MPHATTGEILQKVKNGELSVAQAEKVLKIDTFAIIGDIARIDLNRHVRRGVPEIVYCEGKTKRQLEQILEALLQTRKGLLAAPIILSKISDEQFRSLGRLVKRLRSRDKQLGRIQLYRKARMAVFDAGKKEAVRNCGRVGLLAAGTSDIPALDEAEILLSVMGSKVLRFNDVGIASLARLEDPLRQLQAFDPDVLIVAAGMEAALPSLIAGLASVPVVGLPTSVGFGYGSRGEAALISMLQACPLGICTVNIDGGVAAGIISWLIARRCAESRQRLKPEKHA